VASLETCAGLWPDAEPRIRDAVDRLGLLEPVTGGQVRSAPPLRLDDGPGTAQPADAGGGRGADLRAHQREP
jgi:hypothetical protein